jgi:hypothetical protein
MKKAMAFLFLTAVLGVHTGLQGASSNDVNASDRAGERSLEDQKVVQSKQVKQIATVKSVPAPSTLLLLGVATGVAMGLGRLWPGRRTK